MLDFFGPDPNIQFHRRSARRQSLVTDTAVLLSTLYSRPCTTTSLVAAGQSSISTVAYWHLDTQPFCLNTNACQDDQQFQNSSTMSFFGGLG